MKYSASKRHQFLYSISVALVYCFRCFVKGDRTGREREGKRSLLMHLILLIKSVFQEISFSLLFALK